MRKRVVSILVMALLVTAGAALPAAADGATVIPFEKEFAEAVGNTLVWQGTAGEHGSLRTVLVRDEIVEAGATWHVVFDWFAADPTFVAEVEGTINLRNGNVAMRGTVVDGAHAGSRIVVRARLDLNDLSSEGTMLITP